LCLKILWEHLLKKKSKEVYSPANIYVQSAQLFCPVLLNTLIYVGTPGREINNME
jgi:hypothetical protein